MPKTSQILILLSVVGIALSGCRHTSQSVRTLNQAVKQANRVLVIDNTTRSARSLPLHADDLQDAFGAVVSSELANEEGFTCLCYADLVVVWLRDDQRLAAFGLQPDSYLTWPEGPATGDLLISNEDAAQLHALVMSAFAAGTPIPFSQVPSLE